MRELGGAAEAAVGRVEHFECRLYDGIDDCRGERGALSSKRFGMRDGVLDHLGLLDDVAVFLVEGVGDGQQDSFEAGTAVVVVGREVSSAVKRFAVRSKKCGQRPAALSADGTYGHLIAAVDVGTLIAIYLYRDEALVYKLGNFRVVVRLAIHDMAPVTPDSADIEQHGLVLALGRGERLFTPFVPLNGLVHGGTQVRGRRAGEGVERLGSHG